MKSRCPWADTDPILETYHDNEWGRPEHDDKKLFELLILEGAQAGLSWLTVLRKRAHYQAVLDGFDPEIIARYDKRKVRTLLQDEGLIRNRLKIEGTISNAKAFLKIQNEHGSFDKFIWRYVGGRQRVNGYALPKSIPPFSPESKTMSKDLKKSGFAFVGPTICYAFMQAAGLVNDHITRCFLYPKK